MKKAFSIIGLMLVNIAVFGQQATIKGIVRERGTQLLLPSAVVHEAGTTNATVCDNSGAYSLSVPAGKHTIVYSFMGYKSDSVTFNLSAGQTVEKNVVLVSTDRELNTVVIGTSKAGRKIQKESVTIEVFKPQIIEQNNITNVRDVLNKVPGVTVLDGSISIRGGSGYAYGSGSRVQMVVDDIPLITPDRGEIKWELVPLENVSQVEVMKGASSVQYGTSALNGVINVRTEVMTKDTFSVSASTFMELFDNPAVASYKWWAPDSLSFLEKPHTVGFTFNYRQKMKDFQWQLGANVQEQKSYLQKELDNRARISAKFLWIPKKLDNRLNVGVSGFVLWRKSAFQFYWKDSTEAYNPDPSVVLNENYFYTVIDPTISYRDKKNNSFRLLNRWFHQESLSSTDKRPKFEMIYNDFQYRHDFGSIAQIMAGVTNTYFQVEDNTLGTHTGNQGGAYLQGEVYWKGLTVSLGGRIEFMNLDSITVLGQPVGRLGINYQFKKFNYLRFGIGQGYRYGSIGERFVSYRLGGTVNILPNPRLQPESGITVELGYKRSFNIGSNWRGYADAAIFYNEYKNMIEFTLDSIAWTSNGIESFFRSKNITQARILGWEFALVGEGTIGKHVMLNFQGGYTYFYGLDLSNKNAQPDAKFFLQETFRNFVKTDSASRLPMLKYRNRHSFKFDLDILLFNRARIGTSVMYYSYMDNIDKAFEIAIKDIEKWRKSREGKGDWIWDLRAGVQITKQLSINFIAKNVLNRDYAIRVAHPNAPRSYTIQLNCKF